MGQIYRHASGTYASLGYGVDGPDISRGFVELESLVRECWVTAHLEQISAGLQQMNASATSSLGHILWSTYWDRLWIFQEILISTHLIFIGQNHAIVPDDLTDGPAWLKIWTGTGSSLLGSVN